MEDIGAFEVSRSFNRCLRELGRESDPWKLLRRAGEVLALELDASWSFGQGNGEGRLGGLQFNDACGDPPKALGELNFPSEPTAEDFFVTASGSTLGLLLWFHRHTQFALVFGLPAVPADSGRRNLLDEVGRYLTSRLRDALELERTRLATVALERRLSDLSLLFKGIDVTLRSVELTKVLRSFMACVTSGEAIGFNRAFLLLLDEEQRELRGTVAVGPSSGEEARHIWTSLERLSLEEVLRRSMEQPQAIAESGSLQARIEDFALPLDPERSLLARAVLSPDPYNIHFYRGEEPEPFADCFGAQQFVVIPILGRERPLGVIVADNLYSGTPIESERVHLLSGLANHVGIVIENALMFEDISRRYAELNEVQAINRALLSSLDYVDVLHRIAQNSASVLQASGSLLFIAPGPEREPRLEMQFHVSGVALPEAATDGCAAIAREMLRLKTGARRTRLEDLPALGTMEVVSAPMSTKDEAVGVLMVYRLDIGIGRGSFDRHSQRFLSIIADQAAIAVLSGRRLQTIRDDQRRIELLNDLLYRNEKLAALGQASSKIAHEIRNPLTALGGFARRMLRSTSLGEEEREAAHVIAQETSRLERILNDQLAFVRSARLQRSSACLNDIVQESLMLLRQQLREGKGELELDLADELPATLLDADRMKQVLVNLLMNAFVAIPKGGRIRVGTRRLEGALELQVANTGPPIPPEIRESLFTPFITTRQEGTGLGLAVVHQIVVEHGGGIEVGSEPPWGTVFRIRLPMHVTEAPGPA